MSIKIEEILMGRAQFHELPPELKQNVVELHSVLQAVRKAYGAPMRITSGYRPPELNATIAGAGAKSWHTQCLAADFADVDCKLWAWALSNLKLLKKLGVYLEDKRWTPTWVHMQIRPPRSKKRIFVPNSKPALKPELWDGKYPPELD